MSEISESRARSAPDYELLKSLCSDAGVRKPGQKIETAEICFRVCCVVLCRSGVTDRETFLPHSLHYLCLLVVTSTMSRRRNWEEFSHCLQKDKPRDFTTAFLQYLSSITTTSGWIFCSQISDKWEVRLSIFNLVVTGPGSD